MRLSPGRGAREAERCLLCPDEPACAAARSASTSRASSRRSAAKDFRGAYDVITDTNLLPAVCGRVCPQENQCEGVCTVGETLEPVAIGRLERFVGDMAIREGWANVPYIEPSGFKVGIVGSGPAGMACAADMAKAGCEVDRLRGVPRARRRAEVRHPRFPPAQRGDRRRDRQADASSASSSSATRWSAACSPSSRCSTRWAFDAVFIGTGAGYPSFMGIPGESLNGVLSANELLTRCNLMRGARIPELTTRRCQLGKRVAVIGAGNTAMDAMRVSLRLGAEKVYCVYRRTRDRGAGARRGDPSRRGGRRRVPLADQPGRGARRRRRAACARMRCIRRWSWASPTSPGRRRPMPVAGSEFEFETDMVVFAIGTNANPIIGQTSKLKLNKRGYIATDENLATSMAGVYAGGDIVTGAATVIEAMGAGRKAARSMKAYLGLRDTECVYDARAAAEHALRHRPRGSTTSRACASPEHAERPLPTAHVTMNDTPCTNVARPVANGTSRATRR